MKNDLFLAQINNKIYGSNDLNSMRAFVKMFFSDCAIVILRQTCTKPLLDNEIEMMLDANNK